MIVADLIRQAYFTAHVIREGEETIGFKAVQALQFLNEIIDNWGSLGVYIPYNDTIPLTLQSNVFSYIVTPVIAEINEANINLGFSGSGSNVIVSLQLATTYDFNTFNFAFPLGRPNYVYLDTEQHFDSVGKLASKLFFYPTPNQSYNVNLIVKNVLSEVTLEQSLVSLPPRMYKTLRYQLASDIRAVYGTELPPAFDIELATLVQQMQAMNPTDYAVQTKDPFHTQRRFTPWGYGPWTGSSV